MFRTKYLDYSELMNQLQDWVTQHPGVAHLQSIGRSAEGRDIPLLTIGRNPDSPRPAVWVDANIHAPELCGSSVALAIAEDVLALKRFEEVFDLYYNSGRYRFTLERLFQHLSGWEAFERLAAWRRKRRAPMLDAALPAVGGGR